MHAPHARYIYKRKPRRKAVSGASLLAVSGTRERRREDSETQRGEVEECALSVIGAARPAPVPQCRLAVGMKTREFFPTYTHVRPATPRTCVRVLSIPQLIETIGFPVVNLFSLSLSLFFSPPLPIPARNM